MTQRRTRALLATGSATVLAVMAATQARAQTAPVAAPDANKVEEVVVTAQRRETSLQNTPIAVTAITANTITRQGINDIRDVERLTPSLSIGGDSELGIIPIVIRGVGTTDPEGTTQDSPIAVYADGVYISRPFGSIFDLPDVDRIEVLRGPQGTLFGRNSSGGAIQVITKQPNGVLDGDIDLSYGSYDDFSARGYVLVPITEDLGFKLAAADSSRRGWAFNQAKDTDYGGETSNLLRGSLRYNTGDLDVVLQADHNYDFGKSQFVNTTLFPDQPIDVNTTNSPSYESRAGDDVSLSVKKKLPFADLDVIAAYVHDTDDENYDADSTAIDLVNLRNIDQTSDQYSLEARLTGEAWSRLHWVSGVFLFAENDLLTGDVVLGSAVTGGAPTPAEELDNNSITRSASIFGEANYDVTDQLQLTAGGRYTYDRKAFVGRNLLLPDPVTVNDSQSWPAFTPRAIAKYKFTSRINGYVSASEGFRSGTWSVTASSPIPAKPETVWNFEAGVKATFLDGRALVDVAAFREDYNNKQEEILIAPGVTAVRNAASATIDGVEAEYQFKLVPHLTLSGSFTYLNARYGTYVGSPSDVPVGVSDVYTGNNLAYAPHIASTVDLAYDIPLGDLGDLMLEGSWQYKSRIFFSRENILIESSAPYSDFDFNVTYQRDQHWSATVFARNATDERHPIQVQDFLNEGFGTPTEYNLPREFGIRLNYRY